MKNYRQLNLYLDRKENYMESQEKNIESNKGKKLITMRQLILLLFSLFLIFLGFIVGRESNIIEEKNDLKVYINGEEQVFRNSSGHKVYPILKDDQIYIPVSGLGSFLGYMTIQNDENNIYLDGDGLIVSGTENTQNTWMDVKYDGVAVTPRNRKNSRIKCKRKISK